MANPIPVDDPADPRIAGYRDIREADLVGRDGRFVVEGEVVLRAALQAGRHRLESVLLARKRWAGLADILQTMPLGAPVYVAPQEALDALVGFHIHRGVLALGRRAPERTADQLLRAMGPRALVVAAFGIGNHDNMGGIFRNAAAFGADAVLLGSDCCDPLYRKAIRVSVGAALTTPFARLDEGVDPIDLLAAHDFESVALSPSGAERLCDLTRADRAALLLGSEGPGLPPQVLARARTVSIPMAGGFDSLNVATTSGIALHQLVFG